MHYSSQNRRHYPEQSQVKVAVLADSMSQEKVSQKLWRDLLLAGAVTSLIMTTLSFIH